MEAIQQVREVISRLLQKNEMKAKLVSLKKEIYNKAMNWQDNIVELTKLIGEVEKLSHVSPEFANLYEELDSKYNLHPLGFKRPRDDSQGDQTGQSRLSRQRTGQASNPYIVKLS